MLRVLADIINKKEKKTNTYYPERSVYSNIRLLIDLINNPDKKYIDKMHLGDILWVKEERYKQYRNRFISENQDLILRLLSDQTYGIITDLIKKTAGNNWYGFTYLITEGLEQGTTKERKKLVKKLYNKYST